MLYLNIVDVSQRMCANDQVGFSLVLSNLHVLPDGIEQLFDYWHRGLLATEVDLNLMLFP